MTVPHISVGAWGPRLSRLPGAPRQHRAEHARAVAAPRAVGRTGVAWIDVAIQTVMATALVMGIVWVVTYGVFTKGVDSFTSWYVAEVVPAFGVGGAGVVQGAEFRDGFFAPHPETPPALTWNAPAELEYAARLDG